MESPIGKEEKLIEEERKYGLNGKGMEDIH